MQNAAVCATLASLLVIAYSRRRRVSSQKHGVARVYILGAGPGSHDLISVRGAEVLKRADVVLTDRLVNQQLVETYCKSGAKIVSVGKSASKKRFSQNSVECELVNEAERAGNDTIVVRLKGGDPFIFGYGLSEVQALDQRGIPWEYIPGLSSAVCLPGLSMQIPLTHKSVSCGFTVLSGHVSPHQAPEWSQLPRTSTPSFTLVVLMCAKNLAHIASFLTHTLTWRQDLPCALIQSGSTPQERCLRSCLASIAEDAHRWDMTEAPLVLVIGEAVGLSKQTEAFREESRAPMDKSVWSAAREDQDDDEWWIFGYGSLVWRPSEDLPHVQVKDGYVTGFCRRFWQASPDHRGTDAAPGRVVTLITAEDEARLTGSSTTSQERVFGRVYKVDPAKKKETMERLLFREKAGYLIKSVQVVLQDGQSQVATVFVALPTNQHFVGPETEEETSQLIKSRVGPSGPNLEYFAELVVALEALGERWKTETLDSHLMALKKELGL